MADWQKPRCCTWLSLAYKKNGVRWVERETLSNSAVQPCSDSVTPTGRNSIQRRILSQFHEFKMTFNEEHCTQKRNPSSRPQSVWYVRSLVESLLGCFLGADGISLSSRWFSSDSFSSDRRVLCVFWQKERQVRVLVWIISYLSGLGISISVTFAHCIRREREVQTIELSVTHSYDVFPAALWLLCVCGVRSVRCHPMLKVPVYRPGTGAYIDLLHSVSFSFFWRVAFSFPFWLFLLFVVRWWECYYVLSEICMWIVSNWLPIH